MSYSLEGQQIIITGASRGIGAELVRVAAKQGAKSIVIGYSSNKTAADELIKTLLQDPLTSKTKYFAVQGNLMDQKTCKDFVQRSIDSLDEDDKQISGLICAAGVGKMITLAQTTEENFQMHLNVDIKGTLFTIQAALPYIKNDGRIIVFGSSVLASTQLLGPGFLHYCMCKAAIDQMVKCLQRDPSIGGPERRIGINCVAPGSTGTDLFYQGKTPELIQQIASGIPEKRIGTPQEVADAIIFLLTPASRWIRGQTVRMNGAQTL